MTELPLRQLARWAVALELEQVPERVRHQAVNQLLSTLAAVYSGWDSDLGRPLERAFGSAGSGSARVLPTGDSAPPAAAALLMASWSMVLDYDDVMLGGHTGHSAVLVPLALAGEDAYSGSQILLAQIVANEVAARINMVCAVGSTRGQMATHLHLLSAAAARCKLEAADEETCFRALSFALSYPAQALFPAFLGSDAKALCAAWPIRMGMESVDAVRAGLAPAADVLDDQRGFFVNNAHVPVREFLGGLGTRWHTETNSYKVHPACGYLSAAIEATLALVHEYDPGPEHIERVDVWSSIFTVGMDSHSAPYLRGADSRVATLTFSTPFIVASAILAKELGPAQLKRPWIRDQRVWQLAARVQSRHDVDLTLRALTADVPIGAALRRTRPLQAAAFGWGLAAKAFGRRGRWRQPWQSLRLVTGLAAAARRHARRSEELSFEQSSKPLAARVEIRLKGGTVLSHAVETPRGFVGAADRDRVRGLMLAKLAAAAESVLGTKHAMEVATSFEGLASWSPQEVQHNLALACRRSVATVA